MCGLNALYRVGDVLCLLAADYCFRLERPSRDRSHERSPLKRAKADTQAAEGDDDPVDPAKRRRLEHESNTQQGEDGGGERNVKQDTHDGAARTGPGGRASHRRAGSELVPLEFEFGEHGATVKVLDLTRESDDDASPVPVPARTALSKRDQDKAMDDVAGVLPHLPPDQIRKVLAKLDWNVEAAIDKLLSVGESPEGDEQPELVVVDDDEADLAGELVPSNSFAEAEPYYHLNWLPKFPADANQGALGIRQIIPENVERAVIVTYQVDMDWLMRRCPVLKRVPWSLIHGERNVGVLPHPPPPNVHYHKPWVLDYGCHHGKMMLLFWKDTLRVAITTANLIQKDYERKTQGIWLQDFPKKRGGASSASSSQGSGLAQDFEDTLVDYFGHMGNERQLQFQPSSLRHYDYSAVRVALVTSVPGYHSRATLNRYGHMRLRGLLSRVTMPAEIERRSSVACQFSSVGSLTAKWVEEEFGQSLMASAGSSDSKKEAQVELVWPTVDYVRSSIDGYAAGGSLCFGESNRKDFMTPLFRQYKAMPESRGRVTPHIKCFTRHRDSHLAWVCLTSANLSKAAWGALQKGNTQLMIRNFEIGVLFLPSHFDDRTFIAGSAPAALSKDSVVIPLPYRIEPLERYGPRDEPWIWDLPRPEPDALGQTRGV